MFTLAAGLTLAVRNLARRRFMLDFIYLALGLGAFALFAAFAASLRRL